jgi:Leucine-rich repeat (LRR) protein
MVMYYIEHPTAIYNPGIYNGSKLELKYMPNLLDHPEIHSCYFNSNDICVICSDLLPPNVKVVSFYGNCLRSDGLPLRWGQSLETILLERNEIRTTNTVAEWPPFLKTLSLDDNPLEDIPQRLPPSLELLSISYCKLRKLSDLPPHVKKIRAYYNSISTVSQLPEHLEYLHLGQNKIQSYTFFRHALPSKLAFLNLDSNLLTSLPDTLPDTIQTLSVASNNLTSLPTHLPASLKLLIANKNRIRSFKPSWKLGQRLFQVHLRDNCITENLLGLKDEEYVEDIFQANNWNLETHHMCALQIQRAFAKYRFRSAMRSWSRLGHIRGELLEVSYAPEIVVKCHDVESIRKGQW